MNGAAAELPWVLHESGTRRGCAGYEIVELGGRRADAEAAWQEYVAGSVKASQYHRLEWRDILLQTFGHRAHYLMAQRRGRVVGVLPLIEMRGRLFGHFLVSLPFLNYGGIVADTPDAEAALALAAMRLLTRTSARHVEMRQSQSGGSWTAFGWHLRRHKAALVLPLRQDAEAHWAALSSRLRGKVRKAEKSGARFSLGGSERLAEFYGVFALNMRNLGTPVYTPKLFRHVLRLWPQAHVLLVHLQGKPVAGAIAVRQGNRVELPWICSDYSCSSFHVNEYLYWKAIEWSFADGATELDFGRSSLDSGTYRFKMQWNTEPRPLSWYYLLAPGASLPELNPENPRYRKLVRLWRKLPLTMANRIGPSIVRNIP